MYFDELNVPRHFSYANILFSFSLFFYSLKECERLKRSLKQSEEDVTMLKEAVEIRDNFLAVCVYNVRFIVIVSYHNLFSLWSQ